MFINEEVNRGTGVEKAGGKGGGGGQVVEWWRWIGGDGETRLGGWMEDTLFTPEKLLEIFHQIWSKVKKTVPKEYL